MERIHPNNSKMPGGLPIIKQLQYKQDLSKLEKGQLLELKEREEKLLSNKKQLDLLPDKGKRIKDFYEKILEEISKQNEIELVGKLFSDLNIKSTGIKKLNQMEWTGNINNKPDVYMDSDDDDEYENDMDPIKILAQSRNLVKTIKVIPPVKSLITEKDMEEIESFKKDTHSESKEIRKISVKENLSKKLENVSESSLNSANSSSSQSDLVDLDGHTLYICDKVIDKLPETEKFKPYKTTKNNTHEPGKEKNNKILKNTHWENTSATPPPIQNKATQLITLKDSIEIQTDYMNKLKNIQENQAAKRLQRLDLIKINLPDENVLKMNKSFTAYQSRNIIENDSSNNDSTDEEVDDVERKGAAVTYPIFD